MYEWFRLKGKMKLFRVVYIRRMAPYVVTSYSILFHSFSQSIHYYLVSDRMIDTIRYDYAYLKLCVFSPRILITSYVYSNYHTFHSIENLTTHEFFSIVIIYRTSENPLMMNLNININRKYILKIFPLWDHEYYLILHEIENDAWKNEYITIDFRCDKDFISWSYFPIMIKEVQIFFKFKIWNQYDWLNIFIFRFVWDGDYKAEILLFFREKIWLINIIINYVFNYE